MFFASVTDRQHAALLTQVLDRHCTLQGIARSDKGRPEAAARILALYRSGMRRAEELDWLMAHH